jgi:conjugative relaxase-like TrwC/TraI family protein
MRKASGPQVGDAKPLGTMHVSVTVLGAGAGEAKRAAGQIVGYLEGDQQAKVNSVSDSRSRAGSNEPDLTPLADGLRSSTSAGGYYADSAETAGKWRGVGASADYFDLGTDVDPEAFKRVLLGQDPNTGEQLLQANGSSGRARGARDRAPSLSTDPDSLLSTTQVAATAGVDDSYVRRLANKTAKLRTEQATAVAEGSPIPETPKSYLDATKDERGRWIVTQPEAERFAADREEPQMMLGFDITWSAPKSVSALYAQGSDKDRQAIDESIEAAVTAGMSYIEREGFHVRRNGNQEVANNMVAASYRHNTNRALEPQLHEHVVVANMATNSLGETRAIDARGLFAHATTAGYLAGAEMRTQLANRLGVAWATPYKGLADIEGVDRDTIMAISSRRQDVLSLSEEMGFFTANARQKAALATRPGKDHSVEASELQDRWRAVLNEVGFDVEAVNGLRDHNDLRLWSPTDTEQLFVHLGSHRGVTEQQAIFDRRDVLQAVATYTNDRMSAAEIEDLADQWLGTEAVIPLEVADGARRETIGFGAAQVSLAPNEQRYTTPHMLAIEQRVASRHAEGINTDHGIVKAQAVEAAINRSSVELGRDQATMVREICTSGDQFQAVIGRAGAGKTTALQAAISAWESADYHVVGVAPFAEAARNLENETGLRSHTLEGLLTRIETSGDARTVIGDRTVIVVDEASTIGNRQLDRLYRHAAEVGATVRTIGDPHQHQSVEAGGLWKHLATQHAANTPNLDINRRQIGPEMAQVRLALDEYRSGQIGAAIERLDNDARVVTAQGWEELLDTMAADWFVDHRSHLEGSSIESKMIAERNSDRHALNRRAQTLLQKAELLGDSITIGDAQFHLGDRVVAQAASPDLRASDAQRRDHVINGSQGTITAIKGSRSSADLVVDFDGLGEIRVPHDFIETEVGPGRGGGLTPCYAITSFKAEGQTYDSGRNLAAPGAVNTEGMYVALTRGRNDQRTYTIAPNDQALDTPELPIIADERTALEALSDSLSKTRGADLATVADPQAAQVADQVQAPIDTLAGRARDLAEARIAAASVSNPDPLTVAALGERPPAGHGRQIWDQAVGDAAVYRVRWNQSEITADGSVLPPPPSSSIEQHGNYQRVEHNVLAANLERMTRMPLNELLDQRHELKTSLPSSPHLDRATPERAVALAKENLWEAREQLDAAKHDHEASQPSRLNRRRDPNATEAARREVDAAARVVASAEVELQRASERLRASRGNATGRAAVQARISSVDRAIDHRIETAVARPSPYLTNTLGKRPDDSAKRDRWDKAATSVETYRHRHLGLTPQDGPLLGKGINEAVGPKPTNLLQLRPWRKVHDDFSRYLAHTVEREPAIEHTL